MCSRRPPGFSLLSVLLMAAALPLLTGCGGMADSTSSPVRLDPGDDRAVTLLLGGDTYFGETYTLPGEDDRAPSQLGYARAMEALRPLIRADWGVVNLETPLDTLVSRSPFAGRKGYLHRGAPDSTLATLAAYGIRGALRANNHTLDDGTPGLQQTLRALAEHGFHSTGAGLNDTLAARPIEVQIPFGPDTAVVLIASGFEQRASYADLNQWYAGPTQPGAMRWDLSEAAAQIRGLRRDHPDAYIIASPHWGQNYAWMGRDQRRLARVLIDAGADLILGHGAHTVQDIEIYRDRWIVYGLGNFVFLSPGRYAKRSALPYSLVARLRVTAVDGEMDVGVSLYPIVSNNLTTGYQPRPVTEDEFSDLHGALLRRAPGDFALRSQLWPRRDAEGHWHFRLRPPRIEQPVTPE